MSVSTEIETKLSEKGWDEGDLSFVSGLSPTMISRLLNKSSRITAKISRIFGIAFNVDESHFLNVQILEDLNGPDQEQKTFTDSDVSCRARWMEVYPIRDMIDRNWIVGENLDRELCAFFQVNDVTEIPFSPFRPHDSPNRS